MADQTHVVQVRFLVLKLRHAHRVIPELEAIHAILAFGDREKGFAVPALDARHQDDVPVPFHRADVENAVDAESRQQMRVGGAVEIITPEQGRVFGGQHREFVPVEKPVARFLPAVGPFQKLLLCSLQLFQFLLEGFFGHRAVVMYQFERVRMMMRVGFVTLNCDSTLAMHLITFHPCPHVQGKYGRSWRPSPARVVLQAN